MDDFEKARSVNVLFAKKAIELGGSPSAEHGIGKIKTGYIGMMYGEKGVREIVALKMRMDPHLIFNRGDMVVIE
jgi:D-lactate dehydrogenase (cytochrome)